MDIHEKELRELIFEVREDEVDGGYTARALGESIFTRADTLEKLRVQIKDAVQCHFDDDQFPKMIHLHYIRDEVLSL